MRFFLLAFLLTVSAATAQPGPGHHVPAGENVLWSSLEFSTKYSGITEYDSDSNTLTISKTPHGASGPIIDLWIWDWTEECYTILGSDSRRLYCYWNPSLDCYDYEEWDGFVQIDHGWIDLK